MVDILQDLTVDEIVHSLQTMSWHLRNTSALSEALNGSLKVEWAILAPGKSVAAIPGEATAKAIRFCWLSFAGRSLVTNVSSRSV